MNIHNDKLDIEKKTVIRVASDLHLEFFNAPIGDLVSHFLPSDPRDASSILVLAGDITSRLEQLESFLRLVSPRFRRVIYIPGNHEYYRSDYDAWNSQATKVLAHISGVVFACNDIGKHTEDGIQFVFGTLWGDGGDSARERNQVGAYLNDFRVIRYQGDLFKVSNMQALHRTQKETLRREIANHSGPLVVVTHHMPSYQLSHPRFGDTATGGFAGKCDDLMTGQSAPMLWIHGHTHDSIDCIIGKTRVVCNPAGYKPEWNTSFNHYFAAPLFVDLTAVADFRQDETIRPSL